jgi:hypothetical protein
MLPQSVCAAAPLPPVCVGSAGAEVMPEGGAIGCCSSGDGTLGGVCTPSSAGAAASGNSTGGIAVTERIGTGSTGAAEGAGGRLRCRLRRLRSHRRAHDPEPDQCPNHPDNHNRQHQLQRDSPPPPWSLHRAPLLRQYRHRSCSGRRLRCRLHIRLGRVHRELCQVQLHRSRWVLRLLSPERRYRLPAVRLLFGARTSARSRTLQLLLEDPHQLLIQREQLLGRGLCWRLRWCTARLRLRRASPEAGQEGLRSVFRQEVRQLLRCNAFHQRYHRVSSWTKILRSG